MNAATELAGVILEQWAAAVAGALESDTIAGGLTVAAGVLALVILTAAYASQLGADPDAPLEDVESVQYGRRVMSTKYKSPRG